MPSPNPKNLTHMLPDDIVRQFPREVLVCGTKCLDRNEVEAFKALLLGRPKPTPSPIIQFVPARVVAGELHMHRRTLARYNRRASELRAKAEAAE